MEQQQYYEGLGRRKESSARVRLSTGQGEFVVNSKFAESFFSRKIDLRTSLAPLRVTGLKGDFDISVKVSGGGISGQADAIRLGIARALLKFNPELRKTLRKHNLLTRDPRAKERKKPGLKRARKAPQYTKR
ncbi:MAG: 30S ribosomal protein S9 [Anaerolineaceae bacterium 4572_78]|nr:MAG: 30S ribosomal protein S9 [Anaerolineaceae bacterium 4572_78]